MIDKNIFDFDDAVSHSSNARRGLAVQSTDRPKPYSLIAIYPPDLVPASNLGNRRRSLLPTLVWGFALLMVAGLGLTAFAFLWPKSQSASNAAAPRIKEPYQVLAAASLGAPPQHPIPRLLAGDSDEKEPAAQKASKAPQKKPVKPDRAKNTVKKTTPKPAAKTGDSRVQTRSPVNGKDGSIEALSAGDPAQDHEARIPGDSLDTAGEPAQDAQPPGRDSPQPEQARPGSAEAAGTVEASVELSRDPMGGDELDLLLNGALEPPARSALPRQGDVEKPGTPAGDKALPSAPDQQQIRSALEAVSPIVERCGDGSGGQIRLKLAVAGATGRIIDARPAQGDAHAGTPVGLCAARQARLAKLPKFESGIIVIEHLFRI